MRIRTLVSPLALAVGLAMTGTASAQVMLGGQVVPEEDMIEVQERCDDLALAAETDPGGTTSDEDDDATDDEGADDGAGDDGTGDDGTDDGTGDDGTNDSDDGTDNGDLESADEVDENLTAINLDSITLDQCVEAGLVDGPVPLTE